jgi:hypothetical protein
MAGRWALAAGLSAAVVLGALGLSLARDDQQAGLALASPVNVEVVLVNGTILEDPDGLLLPEGAVVRVGDMGSARIGDTVLGPGDVATVAHGGVDVVRPTPVGVIPGSPPARTPRPVPTPGTATGSPRVSPTPVATPTPSPEPKPTGSPAPTSRPARSPAATTVAATARPTPTPTPAIVRPRLRAALVDGPRIAVRWTGTWSAARYVLVATMSRSGPAADPDYPGSRIVGEFTVPPERAFRVRVPDGVVEARLMVVALRENGRVLRRSRIVTVVIQAPAGTGGSNPGPSPTSTLTPASIASPSLTPAP